MAQNQEDTEQIMEDYVAWENGDSSKLDVMSESVDVYNPGLPGGEVHNREEWTAYFDRIQVAFPDYEVQTVSRSHGRQHGNTRDTDHRDAPIRVQGYPCDRTGRRDSRDGQVSHRGREDRRDPSLLRHGGATGPTRPHLPRSSRPTPETRTGKDQQLADRSSQ